MLGSPILYLKGRRRMMFQLSGFYCRFLFRELKINIGFWGRFLGSAGGSSVQTALVSGGLQH